MAVLAEVSTDQIRRLLAGRTSLNNPLWLPQPAVPDTDPLDLLDLSGQQLLEVIRDRSSKGAVGLFEPRSGRGTCLDSGAEQHVGYRRFGDAGAFKFRYSTRKAFHITLGFCSVNDLQGSLRFGGYLAIPDEDSAAHMVFAASIERVLGWAEITRKVFVDKDNVLTLGWDNSLQERDGYIRMLARNLPKAT